MINFQEKTEDLHKLGVSDDFLENKQKKKQTILRVLY